MLYTLGDNTVMLLGLTLRL